MRIYLSYLYNDHILRIPLLLIFIITHSTEVVAQDLHSSRQTFEEGLVFYNGEYIAAPYQIDHEDNSIHINGVELSASVTVPEQFRGKEFDEQRFRRSRIRESRFSRISQLESNTEKLSRFLIRSLENSNVIVLFDDEVPVSLDSASQQYALFSLLLARSQDVSSLQIALDSDENATALEKWQNWIKGYIPPPMLKEIMNEFVKKIDDQETDLKNKMAASGMLETLAYPMTLACIIISVLAFGQLLQWIGKGFAEREERKLESERYLVMALFLMLGMSLIDLAWTILAGQAGIMREVNPVAAMYMDSPQQLAIFKVIATLIGLSILYIWRQKPVMQQATWWMCLVCVLVTFRWIVFNSMMS